MGYGDYLDGRNGNMFAKGWGQVGYQTHLNELQKQKWAESDKKVAAEVAARKARSSTSTSSTLDFGSSTFSRGSSSGSDSASEFFEFVWELSGFLEPLEELLEPATWQSLFIFLAAVSAIWIGLAGGSWLAIGAAAIAGYAVLGLLYCILRVVTGLALLALLIGVCLGCLYLVIKFIEAVA